MRFLFYLILLMPLLVKGQSDLSRHLDEVSLKFDLPGKEWYFKDKDRNEKGVIVYTFKREIITDSSGVQIHPTIAFIIEEADPKVDVVTYAAMKRVNMPFDVDEVFIHDSGPIKYKNAVAFKTHYEEQGLKHIVYYVCLKTKKEKNKAVQMVLDTTESIWATVGPEFQKLLLSLK